MGKDHGRIGEPLEACQFSFMYMEQNTICRMKSAGPTFIIKLWMMLITELSQFINGWTTKISFSLSKTYDTVIGLDREALLNKNL